MISSEKTVSHSIEDYQLYNNFGEIKNEKTFYNPEMDSSLVGFNNSFQIIVS